MLETFKAYEGLVTTDIPQATIYDNGADSVFGTLVVIFYILYLGSFFIAHYVIQGIFLMEAGKKLGYKYLWFSWIPVLQTIMKLNLVGMSGWYMLMFLLLLVPMLGWIALFVFGVYIWMKLSKACGKPDYLGLFMLAPFGLFALPLYLTFSKEN